MPVRLFLVSSKGLTWGALSRSHPCHGSVEQAAARAPSSPSQPSPLPAWPAETCRHMQPDLAPTSATILLYALSQRWPTCSTASGASLHLKSARASVAERCSNPAFPAYPSCRPTIKFTIVPMTPDRQTHQLVAAAASCPAAGIPEPVKVDAAAGVGGVRALHKGQQALDGLQELARGLVVHDVRGAIHDVGDLLT